MDCQVKKPKGWPSDVEYLPCHSKPSPALPPALHDRFCSEPPACSKYHARHSESLVVILKIDSSSPFDSSRDPKSGHRENERSCHPAVGQRGLFAAKDIPPNTFIVPYFGHVHLESETDEQSNYDMLLTRVPGIGSISIDATTTGNVARFVNDYRGISIRPNCNIVSWAENGLEGMGIESASKPIKAGTELCVSYGKGFWSRFKSEEGADEDLSTSKTVRLKSGALADVGQSNRDHISALLDRQRARLALHKTRASPQDPFEKEKFGEHHSKPSMDEG
ncbi:SET domain-containing protein [Violaceomyces palustris]|uniref:SET domain-containing protein n=1 Tax=Violaceomyces palustris TaxID=1673888 RepID=A0ACD0NSZ0_9BASI|nr:SET domain-containing protein [Violaceomyces palustris]